jgi:hypothetical protein
LTVAVTLFLALGACTQVPAPGARVAVVSAPLAESPCGTTGPIAAPSQEVVIAPSVDNLLADMRAQQAISECKRVPDAGPTVLALPSVAATEPVAAPPVAAPQAPPAQLAIQTQTTVAAAVVPVDDGGRQAAIHAQNATQDWIATQQILNRPNTNRETVALYASLCKSGDRSSCLMAQALGLKDP